MIFELFMLMVGLGAGSLGVHKLRQEPRSNTYQPASTLGEFAWLENGPNRVAEAWLAALIDGGWLTVEHKPDHTPKGFRRTLGLDPPSDYELTDALYALPNFGNGDDLKKAWRGPMNRLQQRLEDKGLLVDGRQRRERDRAASGAVATLAMLGLFLMVGGIPAAAFFAGGAALSLLAFGTLGRAPRLTQEGRAQRARFRRLNAATERAPTRGNLGTAVALGGMMVLAGTPFQAMAYPVAPRSEGSSSGGCGAATGFMDDGGNAAGESGAATGGGVDGGSSATGGGIGGDSGSSGCGGGGCGGCGG